MPNASHSELSSRRHPGSRFQSRMAGLARMYSLKGRFFFSQTPRNLDTSTSNQLYFSPNSPLLLPEEGYVKAPHRSGWRNHLQQNSYLIVLLFNSFCRKYRSLFPYSLQKHYLHLSNYVLKQERDLHWASRSSPASNPAADPHIPLWYQ